MPLHAYGNAAPGTAPSTLHRTQHRTQNPEPRTQMLLLLALLQIGSPAGPVPPDRLVARRAALMEKIGTGIAVLQGAAERSLDPPDADYAQDSDFRQDSDLFYLTGLEVPDAWLVLVARASGPDRVFLFLPPREPNKERWLGARMGPGPEAAAAAGLAAGDVRSTADRERVLDSLMAAADSPVRSGALFARRSARTAASPEFRRLISGRGPGRGSPPPAGGSSRDQGRRRDSPLAPRGRNLRGGPRGRDQGRAARAPGSTSSRRPRNTSSAGWAPSGWGIRASWGRGSTAPCCTTTRAGAQLKSGDLIVMDMAAEFGYYTADVTRTIPANGKFTPRQRAVYDLVLGAQQAALDSLRPGSRLGQLDGIARRYIRDALARHLRPPDLRRLLHPLAGSLHRDGRARCGAL